MLHAKGLKMSGKKTIELPGMKMRVPVFKDENGKLWDDIHPLYQEETLKLLVDGVGMIRGYSEYADAFTLFEDEINNVIEIAYEDLPADFFNPGMFTAWAWFEDKGVCRRYIPDEENLETNKVMKACLISDIDEALKPIYLAEKYGEQTKEEEARKESLERLLIKVGRIDPNDRDIVWPTVD